MAQRIAVAVVHGVGKENPDFAKGISDEVRGRVAKELGVKSGEEGLEIEPVYWAPILQERENRLWGRLSGSTLRWTDARQFMIDYAGDAIAYQPQDGKRDVYGAVHAVFARSLKRLAQRAGPKAPLCVISHSLGTVIASNYFYDLQRDPSGRSLDADVQAELGTTPLDRGETLTLFYTLGSPLAMWGIRHPNFGRPVRVPAPTLPKHHAGLSGEWVNFYDPDDVIAYPLRPLSDAYHAAVKEDRVVNAGGLLTSWNPASHLKYWTDNEVTKPIAEGLGRVFRKVNPIRATP